MDFPMVQKAQSSYFPPLLCWAVNAELPQCKDIPQTDRFLSIFRAFLSALEFCLYVANHTAVDPVECGCFVGLHNHVGLTSSHQFCIMYTCTFSWFNFPMFTICGVRNNIPLPEEDLM